MSLSFNSQSTSPARVGITADTLRTVQLSPLSGRGVTQDLWSLPTNPPTGLRRHNGSSSSISEWSHFYVLPVLLLEFVAIALSKAVLPGVLLETYGEHVYLVMGAAECARGLLAFVACPFFGKISDVIGRRICLFVTVLGTCAPICLLAFFSWDQERFDEDSGDNGEGISSPFMVVQVRATLHPTAVNMFVIMLGLSGLFSSTFTLVFAYISDTVKNQEDRVSAYGLALATFGLSFTIGPMMGGYLAQYNVQHVFVTSLFLTALDLLYVYLILPESREVETVPSSSRSTLSFMTMDRFAWKPWDTLRLIATDPFLRKVGKVAFLYYTGLWAVISTLSVYAVKRFHLSPSRLGELMSALGLCTMVAEAVLVRIMVPMFGEKLSMKIGLVSFGLQCIVLGFAYSGWHLFLCAFFSMLGNLVYPALSSLVSGNVEPDAVGEALGAVNGIKALTEGIGPLVFGSLMTLSERSPLPGWPYLLAALLVAAAYQATDELPDVEEDDYVHELERKHGGLELRTRRQLNPNEEEEIEFLLSDIDDLSEVDESSTF